MKISSSKSSKLANTQPSSLSKAQIIQKHLDQVRTSFKPAQMLTILSAALILFGTGLSCSGKVEQGAILSEGGKNLCIVSECLFKQTKEANNQLDKREKDED
jgi:hypothetical protein